MLPDSGNCPQIKGILVVFRDQDRLVRDFLKFQMGHVWSGHVQSGLLLEWLCTIWCMFLIQTCARLLVQECMTAHLQAVMMIRFVVTKHPLQLGENLLIWEIFFLRVGNLHLLNLVTLATLQETV